MVGGMMLLQWLTFVSATLAAGFQARKAVQGWLYDRLDRREARRVRIAGWSQTGVDTWDVQLGEPAANPDPSQRSASLTVTVCNMDGQPSPDQAGRLRRYLADNDCLSRNPSPDELRALDQAMQDGRKLDSGGLALDAW